MAANESLTELIAGTYLFQGLGDAALQALAQEMRKVTYDAGQLIFTRGDDGRDAYLIDEGRVRLSVLTPEGRELSFAHAERGAIFGEIAMVDEGPRSADATAVTKATAYALSRNAFLRVVQKEAAVGDAMMRFLCRRIREADQQLEAIALCPIEMRLARFFLAAVNAKEADALDSDVEVAFTMSQSELALLIGASRPKVNTALSMLEANGAIKRGKKSIICNVDELENIAGLD